MPIQLHATDEELDLIRKKAHEAKMPLIGYILAAAMNPERFAASKVQGGDSGQPQSQ